MGVTIQSDELDELTDRLPSTLDKLDDALDQLVNAAAQVEKFFDAVYSLVPWIKRLLIALTVAVPATAVAVLVAVIL